MLLVSHLPEPEAICLLLEEALGWRTPEDLFVISLRALRVLSPPPGFFFWASTVPMLLPEAAAAVTTDSETANIKKKNKSLVSKHIHQHHLKRYDSEEKKRFLLLRWMGGAFSSGKIICWWRVFMFAIRVSICSTRNKKLVNFMEQMNIGNHQKQSNLISKKNHIN